jgi:hypothetical protein
MAEEENDVDNDESSSSAADEMRRQEETILELVERHHTSIRPAMLVQELGISVNEASSILCSLMAAVGSEASFTFEHPTNDQTTTSSQHASVPIMVFQFPPNVRTRLERQQKQQDLKEVLRTAAGILWKLLQILTALGLLLSLCIISIAAVLTLVAALVAVSRDRRNAHGRNTIIREIRNIIIALRQFAFLYVLWGPSENDHESSMRHELAYDFWLVSSICCGNPLFFFYRASILNQRRHRGRYRNWGRSFYRSQWDQGEESGIDGVRLIRSNRWSEDDDTGSSSRSDSTSEYKGLLSVCVEFLFGPTVSPRPTEVEKWKLRSAVILEHCDSNNVNNTGAVTLKELSPYADHPPKSLDDTNSIQSQGMIMVSYFNGVPSQNASTSSKNPDMNNGPQFIFPELASEGIISSRTTDWKQPPNMETLSLTKILKDVLFVSPAPPNGGRSLRDDASSSSSLPPYLYEHPVSFTKLSMQQFLKALGLVLLNAIGVYWMNQSCQPNGMLSELLGPPTTATLQWTLLPLLIFYAKLFVVLPLLRLAYILSQNYVRMQRNMRRRSLAEALTTSYEDADK